MSETKEYAEIQGPWGLNDADVARLERELAHEERAARDAKSWTWRTRHEMNAESIRLRLTGATVDRKLRERERETEERRRTNQQFDAAAQQRLTSGRYAPTVPWDESSVPDQLDGKNAIRSPSKGDLSSTGTKVQTAGNVMPATERVVRGCFGDVILS